MNPEEKALLIRIDERTAQILSKVESHDGDIRALHSRVNGLSGKQNWMLGFAGAIGFAASFLFTLFGLK